MIIEISKKGKIILMKGKIRIVWWLIVNVLSWVNCVGIVIGIFIVFIVLLVILVIK